MEEKDKNELIEKDLLSLAKSKQEGLIKNIIEEDNVDKLKDLTHLFNAHQTKRQILRTNALNDLQDALVGQMLEKLNQVPDNFNNTDIANWMRVVTQALDATQKSVSQIDTVPIVNIQQNNQINLNSVGTLSKESRDKISEVLNQILKKDKNPIDLDDDKDVLYSDESENTISDPNSTEDSNLNE